MVSSVQTQPSSVRSLVLFFAGAYGFTWFLQGLITLLGLPYSSAAAQILYIASIMGPLVAAVALSAAQAGPGGLRELLGRIRWRFHPVWYLVAIGTVYGVNFAGIGLYRLFGGAIDAPVFRLPADGLLLMIIGQLYVMFAEEVGWRGFAYPRLLERLGAVPATLILAVMHAAWHLPMFIVPGSNQYGSSFGKYLITVLFWQVVISLLYNRTRGSILPAMLFHMFLNFAAFTMSAPGWAWDIIMLLRILTILTLLPLLYHLHRKTPADA